MCSISTPVDFMASPFFLYILWLWVQLNNFIFSLLISLQMKKSEFFDHYVVLYTLSDLLIMPTSNERILNPKQRLLWGMLWVLTTQYIDNNKNNISQIQTI
jgi:hypothetical protein